jgi:biopolymer transport protein ExbD
LDELGSRLRAILEDDDRKMVMLRADTGTPHGQVVEVIDVLKEAGAEGLQIATRAKEQ